MEREIRYVDRVRSALGLSQVLCAPPRSAERNGTVTGWIPALRFPIWTHCQKCALLHRAPWRNGGGGGNGGRGSDAGRAGVVDECSECGGRLEQVPWVLVHEEGYLADVPWHDLAHGDTRNPEQRQCGRDWTASYLQLRDTGTERQIHCNRCGANDRLRGGALPRIPFPSGTWQQPWVREPPAQSPEALAWLMGINDVRVHSSMTRTALVIPPESRIRRETVLDRLYGSSGNQRSEFGTLETGLARRECHQPARRRVPVHSRRHRGGNRGD